MKLILFLLLIGLFLFGCETSEKAVDNKMQNYGEKVSYASGSELKYPDLSIRFLGRREAKTSNDFLFPQKMTFYDFEVAKGETRKKISWSSGTGDIAPTFFEIEGADYVLELAQSEIIKGGLGEGNLILWTEAGFTGGSNKNSR